MNLCLVSRFVSRCILIVPSVHCHGEKGRRCRRAPPPPPPPPLPLVAWKLEDDGTGADVVQVFQNEFSRIQG